MSNPWLKIPLSDYESHISLPTIAQAEMFAFEFSEALRRFSPESVAVIGCAGGNGFDRVPATTKRVVGVDINPDYIATASSRYSQHIPGLELHVADIQAAPPPFAAVDLIFAALVFEYVALSATLGNLTQVCRPGGRLVALLQQPSAHVHAVSPSPFTSIQTLVPLMRLVPPSELTECASPFGFMLESQKMIRLESGKEFAVQVYCHAWESIKLTDPSLGNSKHAIERSKADREKHSSH
ncbi:MAG TPA: class I SAM-dependent methyltransferase [Accumulibacter sp.]|nr:class I SAM-dependent methyltransferase [Accumulibacter sp.]HMW16833.1 class I SAM-dependent methyltransferase [Accumulibacter sp.]HMX21650.1 class I SAM-dependent methyltransferase [Accumulibacter sp.]HMY07666.1 class I SAM-dependent methyltransferase [Accumulibacter sp.]HNC17080.1 class I SAM-dependent methyltransferase [Accumulibacter sp.]